MQAFMKELSRHIGHNTDVPAGDIGVSLFLTFPILASIRTTFADSTLTVAAGRRTGDWLHVWSLQGCQERVGRYPDW